MILRQSEPSDLPFLREMLYEAVFWRESTNKPAFEEGLAYPDVHKSMADWGKRPGDTAVIAIMDTTPVGAAWYRFWTDDHFIMGYIDEKTPIVGIAVHQDHRHQGIGTKMMQWLIDHAAKQAIPRLSLNVTKDNVAINLYRQQGFLEYADRGDAFTMVRNIVDELV